MKQIFSFVLKQMQVQEEPSILARKKYGTLATKKKPEDKSLLSKRKYGKTYERRDSE